MTTTEQSNHFITRLQSIVDRFGDRPAVVEDGKTTLTFLQLWNTAGKVAAWLESENVGPNSVVAISLKKSADWIAAMIGIWRCGAAWVPIELSLPSDRADFLVEDSRAIWTIDHQNLSNAIKSFDGIAARSPTGPLENIAYLIYTSGTTGKPKGVEVSHRYLVPMLDQQIDVIQLDQFSRSLFLLSTSFDAAISDIGTALLSGAALYIESSLEQDTRLTATPEQLLNVLADREISYLDCPPSLLAKLDPKRCPETLKSILIGGEVCPADVIRQWAAVVRLINVYGPTECTICSSFALCSSDGEDRPLIGQPLAGVEYIIASESSELLIGGDGLAIGYRNMPDLTAKKFVWIDGQRFYRTGDRINQDPDGEYVFLGRIDRQIKLRGHRIEPMEIESILLLHASVLQAAITVLETAGRSQLVAFLVTNDPTNAALKDNLRTIVQQRFPKYSMPQRWEFLDAMPKTPSGKIDYQKLKLLTPQTKEERRPQKTLSTSEQLLFEIFAAVLGHQQFHAFDSFVAAGGDSLNAMEVIVRADAAGWAISPGKLLSKDGSVTAIAKDRYRSTLSKNDTWSADYLSKDVLELINQPEVQLDANHSPVNDWKKPARVLLTGATGFLGARLLDRLLSHDPSIEVVCLVRGTEHQQAKQRLFEILAQQQIHLSPQQAKRMQVCVGNIEHSKLGLTDDQHTSLSNSIDHIIHSAAHVNALLSYQRLRSANVLGTLNLAIFAATGSFKRIDVISTLSVFVGSDRCCGIHRESSSTTNANQLFGGYAASKWAAEFLLRQASKNWTSNRVRYFRPGLLTADTTTGIPPTQDLLTLTVRGLAALGCVPRTDARFKVDITPVNIAVDAMAKLMLNKTQANTFHFAHPDGLPANALFDGIKRCQSNVETLDLDRFKKRLNQHKLDASTITVALALDRALNSIDVTTPNAVDLFQATQTQFDMTNTIAELSFINENWSPPSLDSAFVNQLVSTLLNS